MRSRARCVECDRRRLPGVLAGACTPRARALPGGETRAYSVRPGRGADEEWTTTLVRAPRGFCVCTPRAGPLAQLFALDALDAVRDAYPDYDVVLLDDGAWVVAASLGPGATDAPCHACCCNNTCFLPHIIRDSDIQWTGRSY